MKISNFITQHDIGDLSGICALADYLNEINNPLGEILQLSLSNLSYPIPDHLPLVHGIDLQAARLLQNKSITLLHDNEIYIRSATNSTYTLNYLGNLLRWGTHDSVNPSLFETISIVPDYLEEILVLAIIKAIFHCKFNTIGNFPTPETIPDKLLLFYLQRLFKSIDLLNHLTNATPTDSDPWHDVNKSYHDTQGYELVIHQHHKQYPDSKVLKDLKDNLTMLLP